MFSPGLVLISEVCPCSWLRICFDFSACDIFINTSPFFQIPCSSREPSLSCAQLGWGVGGCRGGCRESWPGNIHPLSRLHPVELINSFSIVGFPAGEALRGIRVSRFRGLRPHGVFTPRSPHGPPLPGLPTPGQLCPGKLPTSFTSALHSLAMFSHLPWEKTGTRGLLSCPCDHKDHLHLNPLGDIMKMQPHQPSQCAQASPGFNTGSPVSWGNPSGLGRWGPLVTLLGPPSGPRRRTSEDSGLGFCVLIHSHG